MIKVRLEKPIDGYEIDAEYRAPKVGEHIATSGFVCKSVIDCTSETYLVLTPKLKSYDWSKTSQDCLVYLATRALCPLYGAHDIKVVGIYEGWQAITGDECPVDESAVNVEYRNFPAIPLAVKPEYFSANQYRVIGLKDGYKY